MKQSLSKQRIQETNKVISTKLSIDDYNAFLILPKPEYEARLIKEEGTSKLLRFTICHILKQVRANKISFSYSYMISSIVQ